MRKRTGHVQAYRLFDAFRAGLLMALALAAAPALAAGNSYLDALKAEAGSAPSVGYTHSAAGANEARTDDQGQMETWLQENWGGSYAFYMRLNDSEKKEVHRLYRSGASITEIREKINELYRSH